MRLVILDRDGVINHDSDAYIKSPEEWQPIAGSLQAIAALTRAGYAVAVATNQAGVGRGLFTLAQLDAIHRKMLNAVQQAGGALAGIFVCPHAPWENCQCRKPGTGLLEQIAERFHTGLAGVPAIGDSLRDIEAAKRVGARPILVRTGNGERTVQQLQGAQRTETFADLAQAARQLVAEIRQ